LPFITMDDYIQMIGLKTAVLIAASAKIGAIIGGATEKNAECIYNYGYNLGLAFQIKDDYFDSFGDSNVFGKKIGGDILCGKKTWLLVESFKRADAKTRQELYNILKTPAAEADAKIQKVLDIYSSLGIREAAEEAMEFYHNKAIDSLRDCNLSKEQTEQLIEFARSLTDREK
ncbi:MAG: polyprenyl synthetase family protein, partial [Bacteroidales bacterium]|nr:polyprenyl synthetase family protein [Bacteroidales bacterium]